MTLSLAYKIDKHTLDKRVSAQERARDLAEQNVDIELKDLKHAVEVRNVSHNSVTLLAFMLVHSVLVID